MPFRPDFPYNDLPPLPPRKDVETKAVLKACIEARAALAELRISGQLIPNQAVLINSIPLLEAQASSEIENIVTTTDRLFRFANEAGNHADSATKEALRYRTALNEGFQTLKQRPVSTSTAITVCQTIKGFRAGYPRDARNGVDERGNGFGKFTRPPRARHFCAINSQNWERYIHEAEEIDPLIRLAVMHYQFEAIHPFTDGQWPDGAGTESALPRRQRPAGHPGTLSQPLHHRQQARLL